MKLSGAPLYMKLPAPTLTVCPSCDEKLDGGDGRDVYGDGYGDGDGSSTSRSSFTFGSKHLYNSFTHPSAFCQLYTFTGQNTVIFVRGFSLVCTYICFELVQLIRAQTLYLMSKCNPLNFKKMFVNGLFDPFSLRNTKVIDVDSV